MQQFVLIPQNNEGMLPSRPNSAIETNIFGDIWTSHKSLGSSYIGYRGQTLSWFHTLGSLQGLEVKLDECRKTTSMCQHVAKYKTQMTNIMF